ncbi:hypothetical protein PRIPAC_89021, partial [Pristionchus pacificus]
LDMQQADQVAGYFNRLGASLLTAKHHSQQVPGDVGVQITEIAKSMEVIGFEFYHNFDHLWNMRPSIQMVIKQQADALTACRELQKAIKQLLDLINFRHFHYKKKVEDQMKVNPQFRWTGPAEMPTIMPVTMPRADPPPIIVHSLQRPINIVVGPQSTPLKAASAARNGDAPNPTVNGVVKEEPLDESMDEPAKVPKKEEMKEVKEEPLDEGFPEVKEEPIADVFCPTTGTARSNDQINFHENGGQGTSTGPESVPQRRATTSTPGNGSIKLRMKRTSQPQSDYHQPYFKNHHVDYDGTREKCPKILDAKMCYLCGKLTDNYSATPTNELNRDVFLKNIILLTPQHKARLASLKKNYNRAFFCKIHVATREIPEPQADDHEETEEERKQREALSIPIKFKPSLNREKIREIGLQPPPKKLAHLQRTCDLCGDPAYPFCFSPKDPPVAKTFFEQLIEMTDKAWETINHFVEIDKRVTVCRKHIRQKTEEPRKERPKFMADLTRDTQRVYKLMRRPVELNVRFFSSLSENPQIICRDLHVMCKSHICSP